MSLKYIFILITFFTFSNFFSQDSYHKSLTIPEALSKDANAVVRFAETKVVIKAIDEMVESEKRIVTVLNKHGNKAIGAYVYYDNNVKVKHVQALIFDAFGNQIEKFKKSDFRDVSAVNGGTLYSDSRVLYLDYTPISYPYTVEFTSEINTSNTAFIPSLIPVRGTFLGIENYQYKINYPDNITLRKKEINLENVQVERDSTDSFKVIYKIKNIEPYKPEAYSPPFKNLVPKVMFATNEFNYEGVQAVAGDWNTMGKWFNDNLLSGRETISKETTSQIRALVANETNPIDKAKKVYKYVQDNTRYISVQVGIGGMRPISASDVDRLKYGDCKGLTNYTKALLDVAGVTSYYTRLYASPHAQLNVSKDFVSFGGQTNHVILNIPQENDNDIWLECTSQSLPFGFIGDFTDDRDVLVVTPKGGIIKHTTKYKTKDNLQILKGKYSLTNEGAISAQVKMISKGIQYDDKYRIENYESRKKDMTYKKRWRYINALSIEDIRILNDKDSIQFKEVITFKARNYAKKAGNRILFAINALNRNTHIPDRYRNRTLPLKIKRGFVQRDEIEVKLPDGFTIESLPKNQTVTNIFGSYNITIEHKSDSVLVYKREFIIKDGEYPKEDYTAFHDFYKQVSKLDNAKVALLKN